MANILKSKKHELDMTQGSIVVNLFRFSIPLVLSGTLQLLFNAADIVVVGRFAGDNSMGAVGSTSSLINLLVNLFIGLSIGANVVAANFFGAGKKKELSDTIHTAMTLSIISGIILTFVGVFGAKYLLVLMQSPEEVLGLATLYLKIYFSGITASIIYNFGSAILRAKGDTKRPLIFLIISGIINVVLNMIFVIVFHMDVAGVALATVLSQCVSAVLVVKCLIFETDDFKLSIKKLKIEMPIFIKIIKIGVPAGIQGIVFSLSNVVIQSAINSFGALVVAGNSAAFNIEGFVYTAMNGISQGTLTFASQNLGARKPERIKKAVGFALGSVFLCGIILGFIIAFCAGPLLGIYSKSADVVKIGMLRLKIIGITYALCGLMDVAANSIRGIGHSFTPMIITLLGACGVRVLWVATIFNIPKYHSPLTIYISYPVSWTLTLVALLLAFKHFIKEETAAIKLATVS